MTTSVEAVYLDSSGLVKLVVQEPESAELERYPRAWPRRVSCALARVEVTRAVRPHGPVAVARAERLLESVHLLQLDDQLLADAAAIEPPSLRSLDALHLAAARAFRGEVTRMVTYDHRTLSGGRAGGRHGGRQEVAARASPHAIRVGNGRFDDPRGEFRKRGPRKRRFCLRLGQPQGEAYLLVGVPGDALPAVQARLEVDPRDAA